MRECCCESMKFFLEENRVDIFYHEEFREHAIGMKNGTSAQQIIHFCPWCGEKLPKNLSDAWFDTLEKEYGIEEPFNEQRNEVPPEFKTDEWWKKRGL